MLEFQYKIILAAKIVKDPQNAIINYHLSSIWNMNIQIRPATLADMPAIHALVHELAVYENAPEQHTATIADYEKDFLANIFQAELAVDTDFEGNTEGSKKVVGLIFYHFAYSTWRGRMMYLEDFVVTESYRQYGVGQLLFDRFLADRKSVV